MNESSPRPAKLSTFAPRITSEAGRLIAELLLEGLPPQLSAVRQRHAQFSDHVDWAALCTIAYRCQIAPTVYQCLRAISFPVPRDVMKWFRVQYYDAYCNNLASISDLRNILDWFSEASIPTIILKGPALAHLGLGMARVFRDLDILVRPSDLSRVDTLLRQHGYAGFPCFSHDYHRIYRREHQDRTSVLEIHFDIFDRNRAYVPDVQGIWSRSRAATVYGLSVHVPSISDHLLLAIMQLPHHHWSMRIVLDIWQLAVRWASEVDWKVFFDTARAWQISALAKSTFYALGSLFGIPLPPEVLAMSRPNGYFERAQWQVSAFVIGEQLQYPFRPRLTWIAPFLIVDRKERVPLMLLKRLVGRWGSSDGRDSAGAVRRGMMLLSALPSMGKIALSSIGKSRLWYDD